MRLNEIMLDTCACEVEAKDKSDDTCKNISHPLSDVRMLKDLSLNPFRVLPLQGLSDLSRTPIQEGHFAYVFEKGAFWRNLRSFLKDLFLFPYPVSDPSPPQGLPEPLRPPQDPHPGGSFCIRVRERSVLEEFKELP